MTPWFYTAAHRVVPLGGALTRLAEETHHSQDQKVRLGVLQGWRLLNQGRFSETRLWMDEMVRQCKDYQLAHQMEMAKYIRKLAIDRIAI